MYKASAGSVVQPPTKIYSRMR